MFIKGINKMSKFELIAMVLMIGYVLDRLYLLPLYVPLDTKPHTKRSAAYLAKTIAKEAHCETLQPLRINYQEKDTVLSIDCLMKDHFFDIYVFLNADKREAWLQSPYIISDSYKMPCFKQGFAYMICEARNSQSKPIFGTKYYHIFPGKDINQKEQ